MELSMLYPVLLIVGLICGVGLYQAWKPLPKGISFRGRQHPATEMTFLRDLTWVDGEGRMHVDQQIFDEVLHMINGATRFILLDMFLYNDFAGKAGAGLRPLAEEVTAALIAGKKRSPGIRIILVTDPINMVYGGLVNPYFERLTRAGVVVCPTRLEDLRDSNVLYSPLWRLCIKPFGTGPGTLLPNPFGAGRVSVRSFLRLLNFKANHRKLIVADGERGLAALVTSANPHDGSSAHGNVGLKFSGTAVADIIACEQAVPGVAEIEPPVVEHRPDTAGAGRATLQVLTEGKIRDALLAELQATGDRDQVRIAMLYISDRQIIRALQDAHRRGARLRILLDSNTQAFGIPKNGIPNRQAAAELAGTGIDVRWGNTGGEQMHAKVVLLDFAGGASFLLLGSANLTRRNLGDFNLETDVAVRGQGQDKVMRDARQYLDLLWSGQEDRVFSVDYADNGDRSLRRRLLYRWMEATGMCTF
jgi:phosphatidylserine/phosphatidylglycerophosphate/cardiolipin synthase-like enzyme